MNKNNSSEVINNIIPIVFKIICILIKKETTEIVMNAQNSFLSFLGEQTLQPIHSIFDLEGAFFIDQKVLPHPITSILSKQQSMKEPDLLKYR